MSVINNITKTIGKYISKAKKRKVKINSKYVMFKVDHRGRFILKKKSSADNPKKNYFTFSPFHDKDPKIKKSLLPLDIQKYIRLIEKQLVRKQKKGGVKTKKKKKKRKTERKKYKLKKYTLKNKKKKNRKRKTKGKRKGKRKGEK